MTVCKTTENEIAKGIKTIGHFLMAASENKSVL